MPFKVKQIDHGEALPQAVFKYSIPCPAPDKTMMFSPVRVESELALCTLDNHEYVIILTQTQLALQQQREAGAVKEDVKSNGNHCTNHDNGEPCTGLPQSSSTQMTASYELFHSNDSHTIFDSTESEVFLEILESLCPFIANGSVMLFKPLLEAFLLPLPITDSRTMVHKLLQLIHTNPTYHNHWAALIESLLTGIGGITEEHRSRVKTLITMAKLRHLNCLNLFFTLPLLIGSQHVATDTSQLTSESIPITLSLDNIKDIKYTTSSSSATISGMMLTEAVADKYAWSCLYLLSMGIDPNSAHDKQSGDTPLHVAVRNDDLLTVKLLLSFGADPVISNSNGETPLTLAQQNGASQIELVLTEIHELQVIANEYYANAGGCTIPDPSSSSDDSSEDICLLAIDGGGSKLITSTKMLYCIQNRLNTLMPESRSNSLDSFFNYFAGTSIGSTLASFFAYRKGSTLAAMVIMVECMDCIMKKPVKQQPMCLEQHIEEYFGKDGVLSDIPEGRRAIIMTSMANVIPFKLHIMSSYGEPRDGQLGPDERKLWEALRAAMAAPSHYPPYDCFVDGGLVANNPTLVGMKEVIKNEPQRKLKCVLSIGTGFVPLRKVDNVGNISFGMSVRKLSDSYVGFKNLATHLLAHALETDGLSEEVAGAWCQSIDAQYYRFSPPLHKEVSLQTTDIDEVIGMVFDTEVYLLKEHRLIDVVAKSLIRAKHGNSK